MKRKSTSQSAFFNLRTLIASVLCLTGIFVGLGSAALYSAPSKHGPVQVNPGAPEVMRMIGPVSTGVNLNDLPYVAPAPRIVGAPLKRYHSGRESEAPTFPQLQSLLEKIFRQIPNMPPPLLTFDGVARPQSGCNCEPSDTNGDVGPNHYVEAVNVSFKVFDKNGNTVAGPTTYNSLFASLTGTPCAGSNQGDPFVFYDQVADRWVITDFAFTSFGGTPSYECMAVSQTPNPAGPYFL